ncbi:MAG: phage tail length tape measure family protein [Treponemataceae bacterium]|nr:phage tail length tape measure family protein [Treponemataceae bacterium]
MADELTEELKVLVTAEVDKAVKNLKQMDRQSKATTELFTKLGKTVGAAFSVKAIIDFARQSVAAYSEQKQAVDVLNATLQATGAAAWTSSGELQEFASSLQGVTNYGDEAILTMQSVLLGFKNIKGDNFKEATKAILDMATVMKMDLSSAAQSIGKALDDPINGIDSLKRQGFNFTQAQKAVIQAMLDTGDIAGAQKIILDELGGTFGGAAEAAANFATQIKNAFGDVLEAFGEGFSEIGKVFTNTDGKNVFAAGLEKYAALYKEGIKDWHRMLNFDDWYQALDKEKQLQEAARQLEIATSRYEKAILPSTKTKYEERIKVWQKDVDLLTQAIKQEKALLAEENARIAAENEISELMYSISQEYQGLAKADPVMQLEAYRQKLEEIAANREALIASDDLGIDASTALKNLDYIEKQVREKIRKLQDDMAKDGAKTWQQWWEEITEIPAASFQNGADAGRQFIEGLESELESDRSLAELLGEQFDLAAALEDQREKIAKVLKELFSINPAEIDEAFQSGDASVQALVQRYLELGDALAALKDTDFSTWEEKFSASVKGVIDKLTELDSKSAQVLADLATGLASTSFDSALSGIETFAEALGEGKDAGDALSDALANMAQQILDQLPMMFLQAGLQLIAGGQWPLGLGLIASAGVAAGVKGFVNGKISEAENGELEANALGGVYGGGCSAFAKGGAFTNQIVASPTFFRFARGSGFGTGLMGEAGPEAVLPLRRGADGSLGVSLYEPASGAASAGDGTAECGLTINIYTTEGDVQTSEKNNADGGRIIDVMIGAVNRGVAEGKLDKSMTSRFGVKVRGI